MAELAFDHPSDLALCGLPIRQADGRLFWPRAGNGAYWSDEIRAARALGTKITYKSGWCYTKNCNCQTFQWVDGLYCQRLALGKNQRGAPIKVALAALYGKFAQRRGDPTWANLLYAGLVTSRVRARVLEAARTAASLDDIVMIATDAIYSRSPLKMETGPALGQWGEAVQHKRLFVVQPGIYWSGKVTKAQGVSGSLFMPHMRRFERAWELFVAFGGQTAPPVVRVKLEFFVGLRLAVMSGKPEEAGLWRVEDDGKGRGFAFRWANKRDQHATLDGTTLITRPAAGRPDLVSVAYGSNDETVAELDFQAMQLDEQPDHVDLSPPK
jgi:hypothetical protein